MFVEKIKFRIHNFLRASIICFIVSGFPNLGISQLILNRETPSPSPSTSTKAAIIIGIKDYDNFQPPLKNSLNDVDSINRLLRLLNFDVFIIKNETRKTIQDSLSKW